MAYCAICDAKFCEGEDAVVIGSGDHAIEEGMYLTKFARKVTVIVLHDEGVLDCNKVSAEKAFQNEKMEFLWNFTIEAVLGEEQDEEEAGPEIWSGSSSGSAGAGQRGSHETLGVHDGKRPNQIPAGCGVSGSVDYPG